MKGRIAQRAYYDRLPDALRAAMADWTALTGRHYGLDRPLPHRGRRDDPRRDGHDRRHGPHRGRPPPRRRAAGSAAIAVTASARSRRPSWPRRSAARRAVAVVERTDEPAAADLPLTRELKAGPGRPSPPTASGSRASSPCRPGSARATSRPATWSRSSTRSTTTPTLRERPYRVVGIRHPLALERGPRSTSGRPARTACAATRSAASARSPRTSSSPPWSASCSACGVQAYPRYGSEKKGLPTTYYLTIADEPIRGHAELDRVEFVPLHDVSAFGLGDPLAGLVDGGTLFIQTPARRSRGDLGIDPGRRPCRDRSPAGSGSPRSTRPPWPGRTRRGPTSLVRMQGVALVGVFLRRRAVRRAGRPRPGAAHGGGPRPARALLRQARRARRRRQPGGRRGRLRQAHRRDRGDRPLRPARGGPPGAGRGRGGGG